MIQTPKPAFPLNVQTLNNEEQAFQRQSMPAVLEFPAQEVPPPPENIDYSPFILRSRALSVFEEESETESVSELPSSSSSITAPQQQQQQQTRQLSSSPSHTNTSPHFPSSPHHSPHSRSRRLNNARSSPNIFGSISKSDVSDNEEDEEDDDIVELMTTSGRFPNKGSTFPRTSPSNSPLLTSRRSPTHYLTGSSDDEVCSVFESNKHRNKRLPYRKRNIAKLSRVDSMSSDDGNSQKDVIKRPGKRDRMLRLRQYNSLPATPADNSASESLTDLLDTLRRNRSGSCRTDSSQSDGGGGGSTAGDKDMTDLAKSLVSKFELSDDDHGHVPMETDDIIISHGNKPARGKVKTNSGSGSTLSIFCSLL